MFDRFSEFYDERHCTDLSYHCMNNTNPLFVIKKTPFSSFAKQKVSKINELFYVFFSIRLNAYAEDQF